MFLLNKNLKNSPKVNQKPESEQEAVISSKLSLFQFRANRKAITAGGWTKNREKKKTLLPKVRGFSEQ